MTVKYLGRKYVVSRSDKRRIEWIKTILFFKRQKRRLQILIKGTDIVLYGGITICWLIFACLSFWFKAYGDAQYTIGSALWEIRNPWFSSVILSMAINMFNRGKEHQKRTRACLKKGERSANGTK